MNTNIFTSSKPRKSRKANKESEEDINFKKALKAELKKLNDIDEYLYEKPMLAKLWTKKQQIRLMLGMKYETVNPYL